MSLKLLALFVFTLAISEVAPRSHAGVFLTARNFPCGEYPVAATVNDFNNDGLDDIASANLISKDVSVLLGQGRGSFGPTNTFAVGAGAAEIASGDQNGNRLVATDLNNDGKLDLAVAVERFSTPKDGLAVLLGNGDGTFQSAVTSLRGDTTDVAAADFNGDGKMDLALTLLFTGTVEVVLGNGDGTFQPATIYSAGGSSETVTAADLNGDGTPDLLIGGAHTPVLLGDGTGGFGPPVVYGTGQSFARVGYFNHDRVPDIVAAGSRFEIGVAFGRGDGSFKAQLSYPLGNRVDGFDSGDFNGDGLTDMVVGHYDDSGNTLTLFLGTGDGGFVEGNTFAQFTGEFVKTTDFNRDGRLDVLVETFDGFGFYSFLGNGDGSFQPGVFTPIHGLAFDLVPTADDFNNDGFPDVVIADSSEDKVMIFLGVGDGTFRAPISSPTGDRPESPITADFNGDGNADVIVSNTSASTVGIYLGNGDGTLKAPLTISALNANHSASGDFNQDGKPDFVLGGDGHKVFIGNGDGTFQPPQQIYPEFWQFGRVKVADLDGDGRLDIAGCADATGVSVLRGNGNGTFQPAKNSPTRQPVHPGIGAGGPDW